MPATAPANNPPETLQTPAQRAVELQREARKHAEEAAHLFVQDLKRLLASATEIGEVASLLPPTFVSTVAKIAKDFDENALTTLEKALLSAVRG